MNATSTEHLMPEVFSVVVLYEDRETRDRVLDVSRHMEAQVGGEIQLRFSWWRFDFLADAELAQDAANAAATADMLLVSAHPGRGLPLTFTQWVEAWLPKRGSQESILVALIGSEHDSQDDAATQYLRVVATRARMDYLAKPLSPSSTTTRLSSTALSQRTEPKSPVLEDFLRQPPPPSHWGINE